MPRNTVITEPRTTQFRTRGSKSTSRSAEKHDKSKRPAMLSTSASKDSVTEKTHAARPSVSFVQKTAPKTATQSAPKTTTQSAPQTAPKSTTQPVPKSTTQSGPKPTTQSGPKPTTQSATKTTAQSATKTTAQSATKTTAQSATKITAQSATKTTAQPASSREPPCSFEKCEPEQQAKLLFECDPSVPPHNRHAEYLGSKGEDRAKVRHHYFEHFDFTGQRLDRAMRAMCDKLLLRAETQQLDRILDAFAKRYIECNPNSVFKTHEIVHTVAFSLFLLNTDLHLADMQGRMTRAQFVQNTLASLAEQLDPQTDPMSPPTSPDIPHSSSAQDLSGLPRAHSRASTTRTLMRRFSVISRRSVDQNEEERSTVQDTLRDMYYSIRHDPIPVPGTQSASRTEEPQPDSQEEDKDLSKSTTEPSEKESSGPDTLPEIEGCLSVKELSPYGRTWFKHWTNAHGHVKKGVLYIYKYSNSARRLYLWREVPLQHSYSSLSERQESVFELFTAYGKIYHMRFPGIAASKSWVEVCTYWAARSSRPPLLGAMTNIDYGWQNVCPEATDPPHADAHVMSPINSGVNGSAKSDPSARNFSFGRMLNMHSRVGDCPTIGEWTEPDVPLAASSLTAAEQVAQTEQYLASVRNELQGHNAVYAPMQAYWAVWPNARARAMSNWERKRAYLEHELIKYTYYSNALNMQVDVKQQFRNA
ncbi:hypothetical protein MCUN1_000574 [Malassezia cuniculi]|uniref:SEC7 domain-containing protein n=1 Tax=Malassezia cuniculi TaxID=948313 RepID=A0AAF0EVM0_9BASI|nr:hypothetical protein MCUN1_000574 [Malassezia cuniculi]